MLTELLLESATTIYGVKKVNLSSIAKAIGGSHRETLRLILVGKTRDEVILPRTRKSIEDYYYKIFSDDIKSCNCDKAN